MGHMIQRRRSGTAERARKSEHRFIDRKRTMEQSTSNNLCQEYIT